MAIDVIMCLLSYSIQFNSICLFWITFKGIKNPREKHAKRHGSMLALCLNEAHDLLVSQSTTKLDVVMGQKVS